MPQTPRGSESSRTLRRRLTATAAGQGFGNWSVDRLRSQHALDEFEREQRARVTRVFDRSVRRIEDARRRVQREFERATKREVIIEYEVAVRGACGSDVHLGGGE